MYDLKIINSIIQRIKNGEKISSISNSTNIPYPTIQRWALGKLGELYQQKQNPKCKYCGESLNDENWNKSQRNRFICVKCSRLQSQQLYRSNANYREKSLIQARNWSKTHREQVRKTNKKTFVKLKHEVLLHYSDNTEKPKCVSCGFDDIRALSIDHINNNGVEERRRININSGKSFYSYLRKMKYPQGYQTLCMNCQFIKRFE